MTENARASRDASDRSTWISGLFFATVIAAHAFGVLGGVTYPLVIIGGIASACIGLRKHRPTVRWPWWAMVATGLLWGAAGVAREATEATGDLTHERSLLPDLFALPGYVLFGLALYGLLRARRVVDESGARLDGIMLGTGALLFVYELLILPTLSIDDAWVMARIAIAIYPAISMCLVVLAARLAFSSGQRSPAFSLVLGGTACLLAGDVVFALGDAGRIVVNERLLEIPFLLVPAAIGSAVLHPSIRFIARPARRPMNTMSRGRLMAVAAALLAPIVVIALHDMSSARSVTTVLCLVLAVAAIMRLAGAMKEQAALGFRLTHQANHDDLTGLPNRVLVVKHIDAMLSESRRTGRPVALMFLDLDQFKLVNDSMGHAVGDQLLVLAAERIGDCVRSNDIVGRISGDEFLVVAAGLDADGAAGLADRVRRVLGAAFLLDAGEVFISVSIGIAVAFGADVDEASTLIQEADTAMYRSKDAGRNAVTVYDTSMLERVARRVELERRLRQALAAGEVVAYFQPLVRLPTGNVVGFEALARWEDDRTMIASSEFIPVAEESGLIVPLGAFMLDEACRSLAHWRRTIPGGEGLYISVNLSPRQVRESDIVDIVAEALLRHGLPGSALWLEITESVMMEDSVSTAGVMVGLRSLGVRLSVDDFGTGFSSLSTLKRFPVSGVKIDRSFVSGLGEHQSDSSLVAAIVAMASALGLVAIAEGVETHDQAARLLALGCTEVQGYLFATAVPFDEVPPTLARLGVAGHADLVARVP
ncbi:MAG TPA: EAL domain-containing protein [Ilumatobacteraceae bacterium]|nr:EAL domain-containing protein [Ilumatobacteraceae bacterium]